MVTENGNPRKSRARRNRDRNKAVSKQLDSIVKEKDIELKADEKENESKTDADDDTDTDDNEHDHYSDAAAIEPSGEEEDYEHENTVDAGKRASTASTLKNELSELTVITELESRDSQTTGESGSNGRSFETPQDGHFAHKSDSVSEWKPLSIDQSEDNSTAEPKQNDELPRLELSQTNSEKQNQPQSHDSRSLAEIETLLALYEKKVSTGELVDREQIVAEYEKKLSLETNLKLEALKKRKDLERELEELTSDVFGEANKMVSTAQREKEQIRLQLEDTKNLLSLKDAECLELKFMIEKMDRPKSSNRGKLERYLNEEAKFNADEALLKLVERVIEIQNDKTREPSELSLPQLFLMLLTPYNETKRMTFEEFDQFVTPCLQVQTMRSEDDGSKYPDSAADSSSSISEKRRSNTILPSDVPDSLYAEVNGLTASPLSTPLSDAPTNLSVSSSGKNTIYKFLKETPFGRKLLNEDIENTLRLDQSSMSYWSRSKIYSAVFESNLVIEPYTHSSALRTSQEICSMCRRSPQEVKIGLTHSFHRNKPDADNFPVCDCCIHRLRSTCNLISIIRQVRDGLWRDDSGDIMNSSKVKIWREINRSRFIMALSRWGLFTNELLL